MLIISCPAIYQSNNSCFKAIIQVFGNKHNSTRNCKWLKHFILESVVLFSREVYKFVMQVNYLSTVQIWESWNSQRKHEVKGWDHLLVTTSTTVSLARLPNIDTPAPQTNVQKLQPLHSLQFPAFACETYMQYSCLICTCLLFVWNLKNA